MLSIRLDPDIERRLEAVAARTGRSADEHVRDAILDHIEDIEDAEIARERLANPARRWTLEEAEREFGLDH
jgi:RHH-type transcriptional regulator, rel operon repressor / antitoxin RelB